MIDKRLVAGGFVGGIMIGIAALALVHNSDPANDFKRGFMGEPSLAQERAAAQGRADPRAAADADRKAEAMARAHAQEGAAVEAAKQRQLASALGHLTFGQLLTLSLIARRFGGGEPINQIPSGPVQPYSGADPSLALLQSMGRSSSTRQPGPAGQVEPVFGANSRSNFGGAENEPPNTGAIDVRTGQFLAPAGSAGYVDPRNGTFYAPSGPNGVVNTRNGEYDPVSH